MRFSICWFTVSLVLATAQPSANAQLEGSTPLSTAGTTETDLKAFLVQLQAAVEKDSRPVVAGLVEYPIKVAIGGKTVTIKSAKEFTAKYDSIVTPALKKTIAAARLETSWANYQGVMFEEGRIWIRPSGPKDQLHIVTINSAPETQNKTP